MLFAITCTDKPGAAALRAATRPAHIAHLSAHAGRILLGGPLLSPEGQAVGSLLVIEAADRAEAEAFAAADPYAKAGLFESVTIRPFRTVFRDGAQVGG
ncbi:MAG: YciI family protein [Acetobacteraceae bacterium]|nr:YciI family protein [Acetobacteraceae bacterium]MCX7684129.1 YciI family protein [Acetobacteraceae bacterium]MDW8399061.1 YciI family protein [Acetobacteraceae bacterium]